MTEVSPTKQLMIAIDYLDKLAIFIVNMTTYYQGADLAIDRQLGTIKNLLSGTPDYAQATEIISKLNADINKATPFIRQRNLDSTAQLKSALDKLSNINHVSAEIKREVNEFLISLSPNKSAFSPLVSQFEKVLDLYNKALQQTVIRHQDNSQDANKGTLHNTITQELKELIAPFYVGNESDKNLQEIENKLNTGLNHKELLECCLIMIRFVIRDVSKDAGATSRLIDNLHASLTHINDNIKITIADSEKKFRARGKYNIQIKEQMTVMESVVSDSQQLTELKAQAKQHLNKMQHALRASAVADQKQQVETIAIMQKMQEHVIALESEASIYKHKLFTERKAALTDQLTKLPNRTAYAEKAQFEVEQAQKLGTPLCIAILDIDHFKKINDTFGHSVGDKTLQVIATRISQSLPKDYFVARWGGEEFVMLLPKTSLEEAFVIVEVIRKQISTLPFKFKGQRVTVTLSCGLSQITQLTTLQEAFETADLFLLKAKNAGRNQTIFKDI